MINDWRYDKYAAKASECRCRCHCCFSSYLLFFRFVFVFAVSICWKIYMKIYIRFGEIFCKLMKWRILRWNTWLELFIWFVYAPTHTHIDFISTFRIHMNDIGATTTITTATNNNHENNNNNMSKLHCMSFRRVFVLLFGIYESTPSYHHWWCWWSSYWDDSLGGGVQCGQAKFDSKLNEGDRKLIEKYYLKIQTHTHKWNWDSRTPIQNLPYYYYIAYRFVLISINRMCIIMAMISLSISAFVPRQPIANFIH